MASTGTIMMGNTPYPVTEGFYLVPPGYAQTSSTIAQTNYGIPLGVEAVRIAWDWTIPNAFVNPSVSLYPAEHLVGQYRWLSIRVSDCNGNNGQLSTDIGSDVIGQEDIRISFRDDTPPPTPSYITGFAATTPGGTCGAGYAVSSESDPVLFTIYPGPWTYSWFCTG